MENRLLKPALEELVRRGEHAIREVLDRSRGEFGVCRFCEVGRGMAHKKQCVVWPLIEWRQATNQAKEAAGEQKEMDLSTPRFQ